MPYRSSAAARELFLKKNWSFLYYRETLLLFSSFSLFFLMLPYVSLFFLIFPSGSMTHRSSAAARKLNRNYNIDFKVKREQGVDQCRLLLGFLLKKQIVIGVVYFKKMQIVIEVVYKKQKICTDVFILKNVS